LRSLLLDEYVFEITSLNPSPGRSPYRLTEYE
jgi:hypothetical protein